MYVTLSVHPVAYHDVTLNIFTSIVSSCVRLVLIYGSFVSNMFLFIFGNLSLKNTVPKRKSSQGEQTVNKWGMRNSLLSELRDEHEDSTALAP